MDHNHNMKGVLSMTREKYTKPQTDVEIFATVDVITTSGNGGEIELPDLEL